MGTGIQVAIATTFTWTAANGTLDLDFGTGTDITGVQLTSDDYRMHLAPTGTDAVRKLQSVIRAAMVTAGRADSADLTVTLGATGLVTIAMSSTTIDPTWTGTLGKLFGFNALSGYSPAASHTGNAPPWYLFVFAGGGQSQWHPRTTMAHGRTMDGAQYGISSDITTWRNDVTLDFIPYDPTYRTLQGETTTPWLPAAADLATLGSHDVPWSCADLCRAALGRVCALSLDWLTDHPSTTSRYHLVSIDGSDLVEPKAEPVTQGWEAYVRWRIKVTRNATTPTETRA